MHRLPLPLRRIIGYYLSRETILALQDNSFSSEKFWSTRAHFRGVSSTTHFVASHISYERTAQPYFKDWRRTEVTKDVPDMLAYEDGVIIDQYDNVFLICQVGTSAQEHFSLPLPYPARQICTSFFITYAEAAKVAPTASGKSAVYYLDDNNNLRLLYCDKEHMIDILLQPDIQQMVIGSFERSVLTIEKGEAWIYQPPNLLIQFENFCSLLQGEKRKIVHDKPIVQVALQIDQYNRYTYYWYLDEDGSCYCANDTEIVSIYSYVRSITMFGLDQVLVHVDNKYLIVNIDHPHPRFRIVDDDCVIFFLKGRPFVLYQGAIMSFDTFNLRGRLDKAHIAFAE